MIAANLAIIKENIKKAAQKGRINPADIKLICVTKGRSIKEIKEAVGCGITDIGENRVREAEAKYSDLKDSGIKWHLAGHLQTNKARGAVRIFDLIHSVDSLKLAKEIDKQAAGVNKVQDILIEVNTSGEETKFGIGPGETLNLIKDIIGLKNIRLLGLMTMAPIVKDGEEARPYFKKLRELNNDLNGFLSTISAEGGSAYGGNYKPLTTLSMGMSQDYEVAVEEGATIVRIGNAIFGA